MFFASDNAGTVHPAILDGLARANTGYVASYGADDLTAAAQARVREVFEAPEAMVHFVATGTAANSLALATLTQPWETAFCSPVAHIHEDECNAPEFYMGAAKLTLVPGSDKIAPEALRTAIAAEESRGVHGPQRGPVSITNLTEKGRAYSLDETRALCDVARDFGLKVHLDGSRFANAMIALGCTPAEMTWKAGVDAVSFGGTKNGCMGVEAVVIFDPAKSWEFELRRKRGAHLFSKHRYLSAQMMAYLEDDLWLDLARRSNAAMARLATGLRDIPGARFLHEPEANMLFACLPRGLHRKLQAEGARYAFYDGDLDSGPDEEPLMARYVADWALTDADIDRYLDLARQG